MPFHNPKLLPDDNEFPKWEKEIEPFLVRLLAHSAEGSAKYWDLAPDLQDFLNRFMSLTDPELLILEKSPETDVLFDDSGLHIVPHGAAPIDPIVVIKIGKAVREVAEELRAALKKGRSRG